MDQYVTFILCKPIWLETSITCNANIPNLYWPTGFGPGAAVSHSPREAGPGIMYSSFITVELGKKKNSFLTTYPTTSNTTISVEICVQRAMQLHPILWCSHHMGRLGQGSWWEVKQTYRGRRKRDFLEGKDFFLISKIIIVQYWKI